MKKSILSFLFLSFCISLIAQDDVQSLDSFKKIKVKSNVKVELIKSNEHKAEIWIKKGKLEDLKIEELGSTLMIEWDNRPKPGQDKRVALIKLYYKELSGVSVSEGARVVSTEMIKADHLELDVFSGAAMTLEVNANTIDADVKYGGFAELYGSTNRLVVMAKSGSSFKGANLEALQVKASARYGGMVRVWASDSINASASGGSSVKYKGNPSVIDISAEKWVVVV